MFDKERVFVAGREWLRPNEIPSIAVYGVTVPEAWETAVLAVLEFGAKIRTEYDIPEDPPSLDSSMMVTVISPLTEPRIHRCFPDSLEGLWIYTREVITGVHDSRVKEGGWSYSYHDRLKNWPGVNGWKEIEPLLRKDFELPFYDQVEIMAQKLVQVPFTRRAQAITWNPMIDSAHHEPPCLQRVWGRLVESDNNQLLFEMNTHWRSRDAFKAAFMNMFALTELQGKISQRISELSGRPVEVGRYTEMVDSYHIYGSYLRRKELLAFQRAVQERAFEKRTFRNNDSLVVEAFGRAEEQLREEPV